MTRAIWKIPYVDRIFFSNLMTKQQHLFLRLRASIIPANLINKTFNIYDGRHYMMLSISPAMVGHRFGDFIFTKSLGKQYKKKSNKNKQKKKR